MPDKLDEIKKRIEEIQAKSAVASDMKAFVTLVVAYVKKNKDELADLSAENLQTVKDSIAYIEENYTKWDKSLDTKINTATGKFDDKLATLKKVVEMALSKKPKDGVDGKDADETKIVEDVLAKIKLPEYEVFTLDEKGEEIVKEINELPTDNDDLKIDAKHIKNLPRSEGISGGGVRMLMNLADVRLSAPSDGQALVYDSVNSVWVNDTISGGGGGSTWFFDQTPTDGGTYTLLQGSIDGANQTFTVSEGQYISGSLIVILNGQVLSQGSGSNEWEEDSFSIGTFTLNTAPSGTDELQAFYTTTAGGGGGNAAGADTQVQFNDAGALNGDTTFLFNKTTNLLTVENVLVSGLTASRAVVTDGSKNLISATTTATEIGYVNGVTSAIQTQLDAKQPLDSDLTTIAGLTATTDNFIVSVASAWASRTPTQVRTTLGLGSAALVATDLADLNEATIEAAIDTLANLTSVQGLTVTLADAGADAILGWDDSAGAYENLTQAEVLAVIGDSSDTAKGVVELAIASEVTTGTDANRAISPDAFAGSDYGKRVVGILVSDPTGSAITTGDGKAYFRVPSVMNGWNLVGVAMSNSTFSSSGIPTVQLRRSRRTNATTRSDADMLSTKLTVDAGEYDSSDATTAAVIDTSNDDVVTGDYIFIDIDVAGTGVKGLFVETIWQLP